MNVSRAEIEKAFRDAVKSQKCPACGAEFTDSAIDWGWIWLEGYRDRIAEEGGLPRDGPFKLRCNGCGKRSLYQALGNRVKLAERQPDC